LHRTVKGLLPTHAQRPYFECHAALQEFRNPSRPAAQQFLSGGTVVDFTQKILNVPEQLQALFEPRTVTGLKQLQRVAEALGLEPKFVKGDGGGTGRK
jgi:hypothetical protein